jgi:methylenetetrahydrofolate dehydrogenase (NADP+)/methenyltetrahydrofolate cyclohydrolase
VSARILHGRPIGEEILRDVIPKLEALRRGGARAKVVALAHPENPASKIYLGMQGRVCDRASIEFMVEWVDPRISPQDLHALIARHNADRSVTGISLHLPLPEGHDQLAAQIAVDPRKDVEGIHPHNIGMIAFREHHPVPCAARAAVEIVRRTLPTLRGLEAVVVGHSSMVGKPLANMLLESKTDAPTVTSCHIATRDLASHTRRADLLFVAVGKAGLIRGDMIKPGAFVVDIGINEVEGRVVGDVEFEGAAAAAAWLTPVPGGVGPVSVSLFLRNALACLQECHRR